MDEVNNMNSEHKEQAPVGASPELFADELDVQGINFLENCGDDVIYYSYGDKFLISEIAQKWLQTHPAVRGTELQQYGKMANYFRYICNSDERVLLYHLDTLGLPFLVRQKTVKQKLSRQLGEQIPRDFYLWLRNNGFFDPEKNVEEGYGGQVPGSKFQVPGSKFQVPGYGGQVPGSKFQVTGSGCKEDADLPDYVQASVDRYLNADLLKVPTHLPPIARQFVDAYPEPMKPVVLRLLAPFIGMLADRVMGMHPMHDKEMFMCQYCVLFAGPSRGKSILKKIAKPLISTLKEHDKKVMDEYDYRKKVNKAKGDHRTKEILDLPVVRKLEASITRQGLLKWQLAAEDMMQIILSPEIDPLLKFNRFANYDDLVREAIDGGNSGQMTSSEDAFSGSTDLYLALSVAGTYDSVLKMFPNKENGLITRFDFVSMPKIWISKTGARPFTKKEKEIIDSNVEHYLDLSYVRKDDFNWEIRPRQMYDSSFLEPFAKSFDAWLESQWMETDDAIYQDFGPRALERGLRFAMSFMPTYECVRDKSTGYLKLKNKKDQNVLINLAEWFAKVTFYSVVACFGNEVRKQSESMAQLTATVKIQPTVFQLLNDEFTSKEVEEVANRCGISSPSFAIINRWKSKGLIVKLPSKKYRKLLKI